MKLEHPKPTAIGIEISEYEVAVLMLPPKLPVNNKITKDDFTLRLETCNAKLRYQLADRVGEQDRAEDPKVDPELEREVAIQRALSKQVYDHNARIFKLSKKKFTDLKFCHQLKLPEAVDPSDEVGLKIRYDAFNQDFSEFQGKHCSLSGKQRSNLNHSQRLGLPKLIERQENKKWKKTCTYKTGM